MKTDVEKVNKNTKEAQSDTFKDYVPYLIIIAFVVLVRSFILTPISVKGESMEPTLKNNDIMVLYKMTKHIRGIKRFDIVVVKTDSGKLIKRVIGLPGDELHYEVKEDEDGKSKGYLYINKELVEEKFLPDEKSAATCKFKSDICKDSIILGKDEYYVMGDNRGGSKDSRFLGPVEKDDIEGTAKLVLFPFTRFGNVE